MAELSFEKVYNELKVVQENAVSLERYEQSQNEVKKLESMLVEANRRIQNGIEDLKKLKLEHEMQTMEVDVIKTERHSLEAEKKTLEVRYNEVCLKLKLKTHQYDILAGQQTITTTQRSAKEMSLQSEKKTTATQTIPSSHVKKEPITIGVVNKPSSLQSNPCKRSASDLPLIPRIKAKHRKKAGSREHIFACDECLVEWGRHVHYDFPHDINHCDAPNPYHKVATFSSAKDLKNHYQEAHGWYRNSKFCGETDCLHTRGHDTSNTSDNYPHGENICGYISSNGSICSRSFRYKNQLKEHKKIIHAKIDAKTRKEIFDLFKLIEHKYSFE